MKIPSQLKPTTIERIELPSGKAISVAKATPVFEIWTGKEVDDDYNGKAILNFFGKPQFAELGILQIFKRDGWDGVWVDTYHGKFRTQYWPKDSKALPAKHNHLLNCIYEVAKSEYGCWDVFCWKDENYIFAESKRCKKDKIKDTQRTWLRAALKCGVPVESLMIVEWSLSGNPQTLKYMNDKLSEFSIYTIRDSRELERIYKDTGKGQFTEKRKWVEGLNLFEQSKRTNTKLPIIFAAAETTVSSGLIYWALITDLSLSEDSTVVSFANLQPITSHLPLSSLKLKSTGALLSDNFIRPLAYVHTPNFLG